jgi:hypothetical protein
MRILGPILLPDASHSPHRSFPRRRQMTTLMILAALAGIAGAAPALAGPVLKAAPPKAAPPPPAKAPPAPSAAAAKPATSAAAPAASGAASATATAARGPSIPSFFAGLKTRDQRLDALAKLIDDRKRTIDQRRQAEQDRIRVRWGSVASLPAIQDELRTHAERVARLQRIQELAEAEGQAAVSARATRALEKEDARDELRLQQLAATAGGAK